MYILDTNVISRLGAETRVLDVGLVAWLRRNGHLCFLSAVTLTEIAYGVERLRLRGASAKAARLKAWLEEVVRFHLARIIPVNEVVALRAGILLAMARATGVEPDTEDAWIAASAEIQGLTVITFNDFHFRPMRWP